MKNGFTIKELADLIQKDGLGTTVGYGVAPEHIQDAELGKLWKEAQDRLLAIQEYVDVRDK